MKMMLSSLIALTLFWVSASNAEIQTSIIGCNFDAIASQPGFNAVLYNYDRPQTTVYSDPAFYAGGFQKGNVAGTASGVTNIAFSIPGGDAKVYGVDVDGSNFAMDYTGYFRPPKTGIYKFDMTEIDDGAMVFIGTAAYDCCKPGSIPKGKADDSLLFSYKAWNKQPDVTSVWVYFEEGSYYPIRIVYVNVLTAGGIGLQVTPPNGSPVDVGSLVYQLENNEASVCKATTITHKFSTATTFITNSYDETTKFIPTETVTKGVTQTVVLEQVYYTRLASTITSVTYGGPIFTSTYYTNIVKGTTTMAAAVIVIGKPAMQTITTSAPVGYTVTVTSQEVKTVNGAVTTSQVVVVQVPRLQTTYIDAPIKTVRTTTSLITTTVNGKPTVTSIVQIVGPTPSTSYIYYTGKTTTTYMTTSKKGSSVTYIEVVAYPRKTTTYSWGEARWQTSTTTYETTVNGKYSSVEMVVKNVPSVTTVYKTGTDQSTRKATATLVTTDRNIVRSYLEVTVFLPHPVTSINVGTVDTTYLTTNGATYYVVQRSSFPTVTTFSKNVDKVYTTYSPVVIDGTTDWEYVVVYPQPSTKVSEWTGLYTQYITSTIYTESTKIAGYEVIEKVPKYSTSIVEWGGSGMKTVTEVGLVTNKFGIVSTSTYRVVYRPSLTIETTTWARPDTSTEYTDTTIFPTNGFPITTSIGIVHIPGTNIIGSWTTTTIPGPCTTSSSSTSSYTTTVNNTPTVIGVIYYNGPSPACFLPPPVATTVTVTKPATDCATHTVSSTTQLTGLDGAVTTSVNIVVQTPSIACSNTATTVTVTRPATGCVSHTASSTTEIAGLNGITTTFVNIVVQTPVGCISTSPSSYRLSTTPSSLAPDRIVSSSSYRSSTTPSSLAPDRIVSSSSYRSSTTPSSLAPEGITSTLDLLSSSSYRLSTTPSSLAPDRIVSSSSYRSSTTPSSLAPEGITSTLDLLSSSSYRSSTTPSSLAPDRIVSSSSYRSSTTPSSLAPDRIVSSSSYRSSTTPSSLAPEGITSTLDLLSSSSYRLSTTPSSLAPDRIVSSSSYRSSTTPSSLAPEGITSTLDLLSSSSYRSSTTPSSLAPDRIVSSSSYRSSTTPSSLAPDRIVSSSSYRSSTTPSSLAPEGITSTLDLLSSSSYRSSTTPSSLAPDRIVSSSSYRSSTTPSSLAPEGITSTLDLLSSSSYRSSTTPSSLAPEGITSTLDLLSSSSYRSSTTPSSLAPEGITSTLDLLSSSSYSVSTIPSSLAPEGVTSTLDLLFSSSYMAPSSSAPEGFTSTLDPSLSTSSPLVPGDSITSSSGSVSSTSFATDIHTTVTSYRLASDCENHTTTSIVASTNVNGSIATSIDIIIETVPLSCQVWTSSLTTTTITSIATTQLNDCKIIPTAGSFTTSITGVDDVVTVIVETTANIPNPTCNIIFTTEPAEGCYSSSYISYVGTRNMQGMYVNATLIVVETMPRSCHITTDLTSTVPYSNQPSTSNGKVTTTNLTPSSVLPEDSMSITVPSSTSLELVPTNAVSITPSLIIVPLTTTATPVTDNDSELSSSLDRSTLPSEASVTSSLPSSSHGETAITTIPSSVLPEDSTRIVDSSSTSLGLVPTDAVSITPSLPMVPLTTTAIPVTSSVSELSSLLSSSSAEVSTTQSVPSITLSLPPAVGTISTTPGEGITATVATTGEPVTDPSLAHVPSDTTSTLSSEGLKTTNTPLSLSAPIVGGEQPTPTTSEPVPLSTAGVPNSPVTPVLTNSHQIPTGGSPSDSAQTEILSPSPSQTSSYSSASPQTSDMQSLSIYAGSGLKILPSAFGVFFTVVLSTFIL